MSKHIVLGDVHLGKGLSIGKPGSGGKLNSRVQDQLNLLDWTLDLAITNETSNIIITGDIYEEPRPHPALIQIFLSWIKRCEKQGIEVDIVVGNHDIVRSGSYSISALDIIPAIELTHANVYKSLATKHYDKISFAFLPYRDRRMYDVATASDALKLLKKELGAVNLPNNTKTVLIGHLALAGSILIGDEVDELLNEIFCPLNIFDAFDYVWMGHIHKPQVLRKAPNRIAHIGSMDRSDFSKTELDHEKYIVLIDTESDVFFKEIKIPTRPLRKVQISVPEDKNTTDFVINSLHSINQEESIENAIVRLEITLEGSESIHSDRDKIQQYLYDKLGAHHICTFSETRNLSPIPIEESAASVFDNDMSIPVAIDAFFNAAKFEEESERDACKELALECLLELKASGKNQKEEAA